MARRVPGPDAPATGVIFNYNTEELLGDAIGQPLSVAARMSMRIAIIDDGSKDDSVGLIKSAFPGCDLMANETNVGFGRASNQALGLV